MRRLKLALLVVVSAVSCVVLVDLVLLAIYGPVRAVENFYELDGRFGYRMRPHQEFVFASPYHGYRAVVRTNARGLRDDEIPLTKPAHQYRVLLLGDSITAGFEVDKDDTFESVCENRLARHGPVQVINAGVRGYNIDNIMGYLEREGLAYEPDVVVYVFVENDLTTETAFRPATTDASRGFTIGGVLGRVSHYSHLTHRFEILRQMWSMRRQRDARAPDDTNVTIPSGVYEFLRNPEFTAAHYAITAQKIGRLSARAQQSGAQFLLAGAPHREEIDPVTQEWWTRTLGRATERFDFDAIRRYLQHVAEQHALHRLDPVPAFREDAARASDYWFHKDNHLNARGHRLLGDLLAQKIETLESFRRWKQANTATQSSAGEPRPRSD